MGGIMTVFSFGGLGWSDWNSARSWRSRRIGQSALPTRLSKVCTCATTKRPVSCTTRSGNCSERASTRVASFEITAATGRMMESISMGHLL